MPPLTVRFLLETVAAIGTVGSLFFYFLSALSMASFISDRHKKLKQPPLPPTELPPVSAPNPWMGIDPEIWESYCSPRDQEYPKFKLISGGTYPADPAVEVV